MCNFSGKMTFFTVNDKEEAATEWCRATDPISGVFIVSHKETIEKLTKDRGIDTLFLKRKPNVTFKDGILHEVFVLCIGSKEAVAEF